MHATEPSFDAVVFDWDGTAVPDRRADASAVRTAVESLCAAGVHLFVVSGTHVGNIDGQLRARPRGPGHLYLCVNRGSEVFAITHSGPELHWRRTATADEEAALDRAASLTVTQLEARGVHAQVVSQRLNRRKIDLIPVPEWADPPKAHIDRLLVAVTARLANAGLAGLSEVVSLAAGAARTAGLAEPRITSDVKHVEIGLTDKSDSARWAAEWLAGRGITGSLVLVAGDEFGPLGGVPGSDSLLLVPQLARAEVVSVGVEPSGVPSPVRHLAGGPVRFQRMLDAQLVRRRQRRVPHIDPDPAWTVPLPEDAASERQAEAIGTLANGFAGVRASREEGGAHAKPLFAVNGVYGGGSEQRMLPGPVWTSLSIDKGGHGDRLLDLRTGVLARHGKAGGLRTMRFVSAARAHVMAMRAEGPVGVLGESQLAPVVTASDPGGGSITVAAREAASIVDGCRCIERLAAWVSPADDRRAGQRLAEAEHDGFDRLLADHRETWAGRWADAQVDIEGNADDELAARFAVFHLLSAAPETGEAAVGARGLSGTAYGGHVFWDADVFVLPALAAIQPAAARAMLEYRVRRLPAARAAAAELGLSGVRFPWESASDGRDVTPANVTGPGGRPIAVRTGVKEEHIVSDVAWAASEYAAWTGDEDFITGPGRELVLGAARYWASRVRVDRDGRGHIDGVMGPDEYHEEVDDNAYTNVMARWTLRRAAQLHAERREAAHWRQLADHIVDGWDPARGVHEQFARYWALEPLLVARVAQPPVAADILLGRERVARSQLIKQPDVLMLHHVVPDELPPGSLAADLAFYGPRTAHGSSLSPAIHAALFARAGQPDDALKWFRLAARIDLDDLTGTTAGGLHMATLGGVWQALATGFCGLRPRGRVLHIDPHLPDAWEAIGLRLRFHGQRVGLRAAHDTVAVTCEAPLSVQIAAGSTVSCKPPGGTFAMALEGS